MANNYKQEHRKGWQVGRKANRRKKNKQDEDEQTGWKNKLEEEQIIVWIAYERRGRKKEQDYRRSKPEEEQI